MMISVAEPRKCVNTRREEARPFSIVCKMPAMASTIASSLEQQGFRLDTAASTALLLDIPRGFALHTLESLRTSAAHVIVVTESPCAEYWEDLWDLAPDILLVGRYQVLDLAGAIVRASRGERYRCTPDITTPLTPTERRMLRLLACGQSNQQIAEQVAMQLQTVKNALVTVYQKLGFKNRSEALLYYWGIWQSFEYTSHALME